MTEDKRKIIQIAAMPSSEKNPPGHLALCNDGTLWFRALGSEWKRSGADIPQDGYVVEGQFNDADDEDVIYDQEGMLV